MKSASIAWRGTSRLSSPDLAGSRALLWVEWLRTEQLVMEQRVIQLRNARLDNRIQLHLALGGSFDSQPSVPELVSSDPWHSRAAHPPFFSVYLALQKLTHRFRARKTGPGRHGNNPVYSLMSAELGCSTDCGRSRRHASRTSSNFDGRASGARLTPGAGQGSARSASRSREKSRIIIFQKNNNILR